MTKPMQGLAAYLRCEAGAAFIGKREVDTLRQWAIEVEQAAQPDCRTLHNFKLVYQGGHHNVYCSGTSHITTKGGTACGGVGDNNIILDVENLCTCNLYKESPNAP